ncbi:PREDICTED: speedy protein E4 isoform X2 [Rhinopithecus bieti]|uniref:speedy protein E4 isoform X2 n=1 Tax=Rhinopithecus bieti TaxID=61621 RepID=UPI00083BF486|nr:PREDICTED: speedy protein E4 isoform X2 [Rhinopithecus bieti]
MASGQAHPPFEEESPQPSTSVQSPQVVTDDEVPGPSDPWVDPSPQPQSLGMKKKREWSDESEEEPEEELELERAPEPQDTWVVEMLCGLKMKLTRKRASSVLPEHHEAFNRLLATWPVTWRRTTRPPNKTSSPSSMARTTPSDPCSISFDTSSSAPCVGGRGFPQRRWRRSRLMTQSTGCGPEIAPSFPRAPGIWRPEVIGLREEHRAQGRGEFSAGSLSQR